MGAKFNIRTDETTHPTKQVDTYLSSAFSDLFDGQSATAAIEGGAPSAHYLADINVSSPPDYGAGTLIGLEHYIYVDTITQGTTTSSPRLKVWKSNIAIGANEGTVTPLHHDIFVSSCHADKSNVYKAEDFSGRPSDTKAITVTNYTAHTTSYPYIFIDEAERYQSYVFSDVSASTLWDHYGNLLPGTQQRVIYLEPEPWEPLETIYKPVNWRSGARGNSFWDANEPRWSKKTLGAAGLPHYNVINTTPTVTDDDESHISADETIFDRIDSYWAEVIMDPGTASKLGGALNRATYSSDKTLDGGTSCKLRTLRQSVTKDGTMNLNAPATTPYGLEYVQHIKMEMDNFPCPIQVDGSGTLNSPQIAGEFSMDIYIEKLNVCFDNSQSTYDGLNGETISRRSLAFMWGEARPKASRSIYDYIREMEDVSLGSPGNSNYMGVFLANLSTVNYDNAAENHGKNGIYCIPSYTSDPGVNWYKTVDKFYAVAKPLDAWSLDADFRIPTATWIKFRFLFRPGASTVRVYVTESKSGEDIGEFDMRPKAGSAIPSGGRWPRYFSIWLNNTLCVGRGVEPADFSDDNVAPGASPETESIVYIDNLTFKNFTPGMKNSSVVEENLGYQDRIELASETGYGIRGVGKKDDEFLWKAERLASNYISLGFADKDAATTGIDASAFHLLFSGYASASIGQNDPVDSDEFGAALLGTSAGGQEPLLGHSAGVLTFGAANDIDLTNYPVTDGKVSYTNADNAIDGFSQKGFLGVNISAAQLARCEERENIFFSSKVNKVTDSYVIEVDDIKPFRVPSGTVFRTYVYGGDYMASPSNFFEGKVVSIDGREVTFNTPVGQWIRDLNLRANVSSLLPSIWCGPKRFWLIFKVRPVNSSGELLPGRSYSSLISTTPGDLSPPDAAVTGATWNESKFTDSKFYNNSWSLFPSEVGSNLEGANDYGYGEYDEVETTGGYVQQFYPEDSKYNKVDLSAMVEVDRLEPEDTTTLLFSAFSPSINHSVLIHTTQGTNIPFTLSIFEDKLPERPILEVEPSDIDPMYPKFTWNASEDDLWYGLLHFDTQVAANQYHRAVAHLPLNEGSVASGPVKNYDYVENDTTAVAIANPPTISYEGLAGYALHFANTADQLTFTTANDPTDKATYLMHVTPTGDHGNLLTDSGSAIEIEALSDWKIQVQVRPSGFLSSVLLTSVSQLPANIPACIIVTVDTTEKANNVKLFINGKLEDQTGVADNTGPTSTSTEHWRIGTNIKTGATYSLGNDGSSNSARCKMEEIVIYNTVVYPVTPRDKEFTLLKNFKELVDDTTGSSLSYSARLFIKDYHNIRGKTGREVATSAPISLRKAAPKIVGAN